MPNHVAADRAFPLATFADVLSGNERYVGSHRDCDLSGSARQGLCIVTCMDSRIDPLAALGMELGDVKILRNAGARVTPDVLANLVAAAYLLGVTRVLVLPHTDCRMAKVDDVQIRQAIMDRAGIDTGILAFGARPDQLTGLREDLDRIRSFDLLPDDLIAAGAVYDVVTGRITPVEA